MLTAIHQTLRPIECSRDPTICILKGKKRFEAQANMVALQTPFSMSRGRYFG